jgi:DNA-directed RNA polymerase subunit M/transcription elongation factor TFIIS
MYYIKINGEDANTLVYYCRFCGHEDNEPTDDGVVVLRTEYKKTEQQFSHMINRYIKHDPTLPRITNVKCPNEGCKSNSSTDKSNSSTDKSNSSTDKSNSSSASGGHDSPKGNESSVIYLRYDDANMKYLYICEHCDTTWKTDDNK